MRIVSGLVVAGLLMALPARAAEPAPAPQPASKYAKLFESVWSTTNKNFYDPHFLGHDWKAIGARYRARLGSVHTDEEFARLTGQMLDELGASHLYIVPPHSSAASGVGIGVQFRDFSGVSIVSDVDPLSDARAKGIKIGDRLLSPAKALRGAPGTMADVKLKTCTGAVRTLKVVREGAYWPPVHPGFAWHAVRVGPDRSIGYLRIDRFDDGAAPLIDQAMEELKDTDGLIIDVRENSGGNFSAARLISYFSGPSQIAIALFSRPYLEKLGHPVTAADVRAAPKVIGAYTTPQVFEAVSKNGGGAAFMTENLHDKEYTKPVVVLIGGDTGSAAEGFAAMMHRMTTAKLVGRETEGALLSSEHFDLSDGWQLVVPVSGLWAADGTDYRDRPTPPDINVTWKPGDLCSGHDPDIEKAKALLNLTATQ